MPTPFLFSSKGEDQKGPRQNYKFNRECRCSPFLIPTHGKKSSAPQTQTPKTPVSLPSINKFYFFCIYLFEFHRRLIQRTASQLSGQIADHRIRVKIRRSSGK
uniref:Uncharacterized protein n=1 Tax=Salix viminalis TaxID=40686 RepID=A0A6N2KUF2_SALVM